jgi:hypothetical protein
MTSKPVWLDLGDLFPELRRLLPSRRVLVPATRIPRGSWIPEPCDEDVLGWIVAGGILIRRLTVLSGTCVEILGRGDLIQPGRAEERELLLDDVSTWTVIDPMLLVKLPRTEGAGPLLAIAVDAAVARVQRLAVQMAVASEVGAERRVLSMLQHLAGRWGRVRRDGVVVPIRLSHSVLAQLVAARRPTVSTAIAALERRGRLRRLPDGCWLLTQPVEPREGLP